MVLSGLSSIYHDSHTDLFTWVSSEQIEWVLETSSEVDAPKEYSTSAFTTTPLERDAFSGEDRYTLLTTVSLSRQGVVFSQKVSSKKRFTELLSSLLSREDLSI